MYFGLYHVCSQGRDGLHRIVLCGRIHQGIRRDAQKSRRARDGVGHLDLDGQVPTYPCHPHARIVVGKAFERFSMGVLATSATHTARGDLVSIPSIVLPDGRLLIRRL